MSETDFSDDPRTGANMRGASKPEAPWTLMVNLGSVESVRLALDEARRRGREEARLRVPRLPSEDERLPFLYRTCLGIYNRFMTRPKKNIEKLFAWLPPVLMKWLEEECERLGCTKSEFVRELLRREMEGRR
jgi:hypothetical protein